ncbi:MAG: B12-binding domain-containing radical SAM protein [Phycisphaerae bacterium]|nr:B12-binding domain-containing radical SAM protein [Phycisphaerae bacterium]
MKIALINPSWLFRNNADVVLSQNLGLGYLASYLRQHGHQIQIIDSLAEGFKQRGKMPNGSLRVGLLDCQVVDLLSNRLDLIGITIPFSHMYEVAESLCCAIKEGYQDIPVVMGGVHPSTCPQDYMTSKADYWLVGEGEIAMRQLADGLEPDQIEGLLSASKPQLLPGEKTQQIMDLDLIPEPARDLLPMDLYKNLSPRRISHKPTASIFTSRGCPWDCQFCSVHPINGYKWRMSSAAKVLQEIRHLVKDYGIRQLEFEDDNLTVNYDRAMEIFDGIYQLRKQLGIELTWGTPNGVRADNGIDRAMLEMMKKSGCVRLTFALEHGDQEIRKIMDKHLNMDKFEQALRDAIDMGIYTEVFTMVGYPGETAERFENGRAYYRKLADWGVNLIHFFYPQPYPGTKLYSFCKEKGYLVSDNYSLLPEIKIETEDFDTREVLRRREVLLCEHDPAYKIRQKAKAILPDRLISFINRLLPRKQM